MRPELPSNLRLIASVTAHAKPDYAIDIVGVENIQSHPVYHLRLRPLSDPARHNLRDLWVDTAAFDLWRAHFIGTYAPSPSQVTSQSDVTTDFKPVAKYWIVAHTTLTYYSIDESASYVFDISADQIALVPSLPDWLFNADEYGRHEQAKEPDYLGLLLAQLASSPAPMQK